MTVAKNPKLMTYMMENVPRDLIERAKLKLSQQEPPGSIKWFLIDCLRDLVDPRPSRERPRKR